MKSHIRHPYSRAQKQAAAELCDTVIQEGIVKAQYLMCVALNDALGIGAKRLGQVFARYEELVEIYREAKSEDIADELVRRRVLQIGLIKGDK